jgi:hypothetical protein
MTLLGNCIYELYGAKCFGGRPGEAQPESNTSECNSLFIIEFIVRDGAWQIVRQSSNSASAEVIGHLAKPTRLPEAAGNDPALRTPKNWQKESVGFMITSSSQGNSAIECFTSKLRTWRSCHILSRPEVDRTMTISPGEEPLPRSIPSLVAFTNGLDKLKHPSRDAIKSAETSFDKPVPSRLFTSTLNRIIGLNVYRMSLRTICVTFEDWGFIQCREKPDGGRIKVVTIIDYSICHDISLNNRENIAKRKEIRVAWVLLCREWHPPVSSTIIISLIVDPSQH